MKFHKRILSILPLLALSGMILVGCSDDDDNGTGPGTTGESMKMDLRGGDSFDYNVWELDDNNQRNGDSKQIRVRYISSGGILVDGFTDWVQVKEEELPSFTLLGEYKIRVDQQNNLWMHNFQHELYKEFFDLLLNFDPTITVPSIGTQQWDEIGQFNDDGGNALPTNTEWDISDPDISPFNISVDIGLPARLDVSIKPVIKGIYEGQVASMTVKGNEVKRWQTKIIITMKVRSLLVNEDIIVEQIVTYSDNPDGQITMKRNSTILNLQDVGSYTQPGEERELSTYIEF